MGPFQTLTWSRLLQRRPTPTVSRAPARNPHPIRSFAQELTVLVDTTSSNISPSSDTNTASLPGPNSNALPPPGKQSTGGNGTTVAPSVPIRLSSATGTTPMNDQTGTSPVPHIKGGSKDKGNSGSGAGADTTRGTPVGETTTGSTGQAETAKPKRKGGFLSFLNCCSAPENDHSVELSDQAVPVKKPKGSQQNQGRQPTPVVGKPNASAAESSAGESKEAAGEGIGGPEYSELKGGAEPTMDAQPSVEKPTIPAAPAALPAPKPPISSNNSTRDAPTPPPKNAPLSNAEPERDLTSSKTAAVNTAEPPQLVEPGESVAAQGTTINDRTPQQEARDSDVVMPDAPPVAPTVPEESTRKTQDFVQTQMNLPPPPPRNGVNPATGDPSNAIVPRDREAPKWLLPPLSPRLAGRKCLVLDLDETLVHSSFKVCSHFPTTQAKLTRIDPSPS